MPSAKPFTAPLVYDEPVFDLKPLLEQLERRAASMGPVPVLFIPERPVPWLAEAVAPIPGPPSPKE